MTFLELGKSFWNSGSMGLANCSLWSTMANSAQTTPLLLIRVLTVRHHLPACEEKYGNIRDYSLTNEDSGCRKPSKSVSGRFRFLPSGPPQPKTSRVHKLRCPGKLMHVDVSMAKGLTFLQAYFGFETMVGPGAQLIRGFI